MTAAFASADRRPALLNDVEWGKPVTARKFRERFPLGSSEFQLVTWLEKNSFTIDRGTRRAVRKVSSLPCAETVSVEWALDAATDQIGRAEVHIMEAGCL